MTSTHTTEAMAIVGLTLSLMATLYVLMVVVRANSRATGETWRATERERRDVQNQMQRLVECCTLKPEQSAEMHWRERLAANGQEAATDRAEINAKYSDDEEGNPVQYPEDASNE